MRVFRSCTTIAIVAEPLDGLRCVIPCYEDEDSERSWSRALRAMCEFEHIGFFDSHWAQKLSRASRARTDRDGGVAALEAAQEDGLHDAHKKLSRRLAYLSFLAVTMRLETP